MANEITIGAQLSASKGGASVTIPLTTKQLDMTGVDIQYETQTIPNSETAYNITTDIGSIGYCFFKNLDTTNSVSIYFASGAEANGITLRPGAVCLFQPFTPTATLYGKSSASTVLVAFASVEL